VNERKKVFSNILKMIVLKNEKGLKKGLKG